MEDRAFEDSSTDVNRASRQFTSSSYSSQDKGHKGWLWLLILLLVLGGIGFGAMKFMGSSSQKEVPLTPTPTQEVTPTDTPIPTPEASPTIKPTSVPTPKPTVNPVDKATGLDRSELSVEVQNGSGEVGAASKGSEVLKSFGYHVIATGNADNFDYENIIIEVKSDKSSYLPLLKKDLGTVYTIGNTSADLSASSSADARVIIGK